MSQHTVRTIATGEYSCTCGAVWDKDEGEECPASNADGHVTGAWIGDKQIYDAPVVNATFEAWWPSVGQTIGEVTARLAFDYAMGLERECRHGLQARINELEAWKAEQMEVMSPLFDYARAVCTGPLGCSLADWLVADHKALRAEQQGVADVSAMARVLADRNADACNVNREDNWAIYGQDYIDDVRAMLTAAPAPSTTEGQGDE